MFARFDLRNVFDRIARHALFPALEAQGCRLFAHGTGHIRGSSLDDLVFEIERGVKQGDVLSPTLFNAGLEQTCKTGSNAYNHTVYKKTTNICNAKDVL